MTDRPIDPDLFDPATPLAQDFYRHVNGGWLDANPVPPEYPAWGGFVEVKVRNEELLRELAEAAAASGADPEGAAAQDPATRRFGAYYAAGIDEAAVEAAGLTPIEPQLEAIAAATTPAALRDVVRALQLAGVGALHGLDVFPDFEHPDRYLAYLGQGGLGLPEPGYYTRDDERSVALRATYLEHITAQLGTLGAEPDGDARTAAEAVLAFETRLASVSWPPEKMRDLSLTLNRHPVAELDALMPLWGLAAHARALGVTSPTLSIDNPGFFRDLDAILAETPLATLHAYLRFAVVRTWASALPAAVADEHFAFFGRTLSGQLEQQARWKRVLDGATRDIGEMVARRFVEVAFPPHAKARCERMVAHLTAAMGRSIDSLDWMTPETRARALAKLATFRARIGYPDRWREDAGLVIDRSSWAGNRMRATAFEIARQLGRLEQPVDRDEWLMPAHAVNAYYHPMLNEIVFPAGILRPPFFHADADDAVNYGGIGTVIGHEITHGFDDQGRSFDEEGRRADWWTEADGAEFERLADRLVAQFDAFEVADGAAVNGRLTLGENIADLGGVAIAFDAFREALADGSASGAPVDGSSPEQRFFLAYATMWRTNMTDAYARMLVNADVHAPPHFRVNGPLSNVPAFAAAFGLVEGSVPMARGAEDRVRIW